MIPIINIFNKLLNLKRVVQSKRKKVFIDEKEAFVSRATFHLLNSVKYIAFQEKLNLDIDADVDRAIKLALQYVFEVVEKTMAERGSLYTHDKFFKEIPTNKLVRQVL